MSKVKYWAMDNSGEIFTGVIPFKAKLVVDIEGFANIKHIILSPSEPRSGLFLDLRREIWDFIDGRIRDDEIARTIKFPNGIVQLEIVDD